MKLCLLLNFASHYRASIFQLIDRSFDCEWCFGDSASDIKKMDYSVLSGPVFESHTRKLFAGWYWQPGILSKLRSQNTHFIITGDVRSLSTWTFCILARLFYPQKKVYFWTHGWYGKETWLESVVKMLEYRLLNGGIFTYGYYAKRLMVEKGMDSNKLFVIHNSLDYDSQLRLRKELVSKPIYSDHFRNDNPNLVFVGRLTPVKKLDQILKSMIVSKSKGHDYNLTLIGGGEMKEYLQDLAAKIGLDSNVWFFGPCYEEQVLASMIYNADLCVSPGNIGLTAMHSMVYGTPCVTHNSFPLQMPEFEAIEEWKTGAFFELNDIESLSDCIDKWFELKSNNRDSVRHDCYTEIDTQWTPYFQLDVLKRNLH